MLLSDGDSQRGQSVSGLLIAVRREEIERVEVGENWDMDYPRCVSNRERVVEEDATFGEGIGQIKVTAFEWMGVMT
jgi:hypothetical protein